MMAEDINLERPSDSPNAEEYDSQTFATWRDDNTASPGARFLIDVATTSVFSKEPRKLSLLFVLFYIAAAGNEDTPGSLKRLASTTGGAQEKRFVGGSGRCPSGWRRASERSCGWVRRSAGSSRSAARKVQLLQQFPLGSIAKAIVVVTKVVDNYATYFGPQARDVRDVRDVVLQRWDLEPWSRGGPVSSTPPGVLLDVGSEIRRPYGRLHWAGTETATYWNGYMGGAVRSGERAAAEVLPLLPPLRRRRVRYAG